MDYAGVRCQHRVNHSRAAALQLLQTTKRCFAIFLYETTRYIFFFDQNLMPTYSSVYRKYNVVFYHTLYYTSCIILYYIILLYYNIILRID
jgi:hypothetical protein